MIAAGVVLCGGKSSRMGTPKAWLPCGPDEVLLQRVVRLIGEAVPHVIVVAAPEQELPALADGVRIARDPVEAPGPLAGLLAGLRSLPPGVDAVYLTGCDHPFVAAAFVRGMLAALGPSLAAVPRVGGFPQPLAGAYRVGVADPVAELLARGERSLRSLLAAVPTRFVEGDELRALDPAGRSWRGVNTPEEWAEALASLSPARTPGRFGA